MGRCTKKRLIYVDYLARFIARKLFKIQYMSNLLENKIRCMWARARKVAEILSLPELLKLIQLTINSENGENQNEELKFLLWSWPIEDNDFPEDSPENATYLICCHGLSCFATERVFTLSIIKQE